MLKPQTPQGHQQLPSWLDEESDYDGIPMVPVSSNSNVNAASIPIPKNGSSSNFLSSYQNDPENKKTMVKGLLKFITMSLCVLMTITALFGLGLMNSVNDVGKFFVALYMLFASIILFSFEASEIRKIEWLDHMFRRNFGFIFHFVGKALFIIFIAFLSFGLGEPETLSFVTGLSFACFGAAEIGLYLKYPEFFE